MVHRWRLAVRGDHVSAAAHGEKKPQSVGCPLTEKPSSPTSPAALAAGEVGDDGL
jgi:hypothetical protein